jgi:nicotinamide mononucleotide transporter
MSKLDISIFIISVLGILLEMVQKPIFWLLYIVGAMLLGYEFITTHLYGSSILQIIYVILSIYGWYKWTNKDAKQHVAVICYTTFKQWINYIIATVVMAIISYYILKYTGDTDYLIDAVLTAVCITATYMAALKQIESWFIFATTVFISVPLYLHHQLYFTSATYVIFGILDVIGGIKWVRDYRRTKVLNASMV